MVVDEADLLLGGGFAKALWQVLDVMRDGDKERRIEALCREVGTSPARFHALPYPIRKQALDGELPAPVLWQPCRWHLVFCQSV